MTQPVPTLRLAVLALRLALLALLPALVGPPGTVAQQADVVALARAYLTAWNDHDLETVLAFFAPDAIVRQDGAAVPDTVWNAQDEVTVSEYRDSALGWGSDLAWARGTVAIRALLADTFRDHPQIEAFDFQASGETVTWRYRLRQEPFQRVPGVGPVEGTADAVVHAGQITRLSTVHDPRSLARRNAALDAALLAWRRRQPALRPAASAASAAGPTTAASPVTETPAGVQGSSGPAGPADIPLPLLFVAMGVASYGVAALRRRRSRRDAAPAPSATASEVVQ
jgi:hypothetical protein